MVNGWRSCETLTFSRITRSVSFVRRLCVPWVMIPQRSLARQIRVTVMFNLTRLAEPMQRTMMLRLVLGWKEGPRLHLGPSSSGATTTCLSGGYTTHIATAVPTAKAMPKSSTSTTRPCPTSQGGQASKIRKIQDVMKNSFPMAPTPSTNRYREMPPISRQACKKACEAVDHGMG